MNYLPQIEQRSEEWYKFKAGKISGTRFGQLISGRENGLVYELANEILDGCIEISDIETEDMIFGIENEDIAINKYEEQTGLKFLRGGMIVSDANSTHIASPDGITKNFEKVIEIKCTRHGEIQLKRFSNGVDSKYLPQIYNYFAMSKDIKEVHFVSYCPFRPERELVSFIFTRDSVVGQKKDKLITINDILQNIDLEIEKLYLQVNKLINDFTKIEF